MIWQGMFDAVNGSIPFMVADVGTVWTAVLAILLILLGLYYIIDMLGSVSVKSSRKD